MSRTLALLFAFVGTFLLVGIGAALSYRSLLGALLLAVVSIAFIGWGFVLKAKLRRKNEARADSSAEPKQP
ncbi:DUF5325 family protein [Paenibacillus oceani]|uniref:DUF5325 family protein n=1 Tax=Paenibacillus oceani TaxID=2772510 RepID=A0A927C5D2_9BACL|nr:DUF5325 family protein [Paenibacillus oceani]MBD2861570.1 DUF5325 family protein [Paenibacillus oceani]